MEMMLRNFLLLLLGGLSLLVSACSTNLGVANYGIKPALANMPQDTKEQLGDFNFYFGKSLDSNVQPLGSVSVNLKTNAFSDDAQVSCNHVFYLALTQLKAKTIQLGGNAIMSIESNWQNNLVSSEAIYVCDNGLWTSGVALTGIAIKEAKNQ